MGDAVRAERAEEIAALVSHELRTPLTVLHAALQLLDRELPRDPALPARRHLEQALTEARQLNLLTSQLWEASRLQSGWLRLRRERLSLLPVVRAVCARAQALAGGQRIELTAPREDIVLYADPTRLEQMLMNLLVNAIIYAHSSPSIDVRVSCGPNDVCIEVRDYGPGLDTSELARLGRAFYQPSRRDRPSRSGLGLGLYLSRELAQLHGGQLDIRSGENHGATFTLRLPLESHEPIRVRQSVAAPGVYGVKREKEEPEAPASGSHLEQPSSG